MQLLNEAKLSLDSKLSHAERYAMGKDLRKKCPRHSHATWQRSAERAETLQLLEESNKGRISKLIPIRYGRMLQSAFTFYRGTALNMAADLSESPTSGLRVQACGDCHLSNFGAYATPERRVVFDINDLDETLPAPWEWDVKRLAASFVVASRHNGHSENAARDAVLQCVRAYREHMAEYSEMPALEVWYSSIDMEDFLPNVKDKDARKRMEKRLAKARERSVLEHDFPELVMQEGAIPLIKDAPPLIYHIADDDEAMELVRKAFAGYRDTLPDHRKLLLDRFELMDLAIKVVGVGSVGTACAILLMMAGKNDPLFLQVKEARASVLEPYVGKSTYANHGQRVVAGYWLMQSASDIFLGWTEGRAGRHFYIRQLKDMKIKALVEVFTPEVMVEYAELCGWTLARAHARSGESVKIAGYLGNGDNFDQAIADFSFLYADQNERDYEVFVQAVREGKLEVMVEDE
jgi:uncharacterized protein (DUF2252 family)